MFVQVYPSGKVGNIYFFPIIFFHISKGGFDGLHALVEIFLNWRKKLVGGEGGKYVKQGRFDI